MANPGAAHGAGGGVAMAAGVLAKDQTGRLMASTLEDGALAPGGEAFLAALVSNGGDTRAAIRDAAKEWDRADHALRAMLVSKAVQRKADKMADEMLQGVERLSTLLTLRTIRAGGPGIKPETQVIAAKALLEEARKLREENAAKPQERLGAALIDLEASAASTEAQMSALARLIARIEGQPKPGKGNPDGKTIDGSMG
jgi:hypothetical protein